MLKSITKSNVHPQCCNVKTAEVSSAVGVACECNSEPILYGDDFIGFAYENRMAFKSSIQADQGALGDGITFIYQYHSAHSCRGCHRPVNPVHAFGSIYP